MYQYINETIDNEKYNIYKANKVHGKESASYFIASSSVASTLCNYMFCSFYLQNLVENLGAGYYRVIFFSFLFLIFFSLFFLLLQVKTVLYNIY